MARATVICNIVLIVLGCAIAGCGRPMEAELVGTWKSHSGPRLEPTFEADYTFRLYVTWVNETETGTWQLKGNELTTILCPKVPSVGEHGDGSTREVHDISIHGNQLVMRRPGESKQIVFDRAK
jgi:hypothetical protein